MVPRRVLRSSATPALVVNRSHFRGDTSSETAEAEGDKARAHDGAQRGTQVRAPSAAAHAAPEARTGACQRGGFTLSPRRLLQEASATSRRGRYRCHRIFSDRQKSTESPERHPVGVCESV